MQLINYKGQIILFLSDTHGKHRLIEIVENINIVIHCGDICNDGNMDEIIDFFAWYTSLKIPYKIFVNGNHDLPFELEPEWSKNLIPMNVHWLYNESVTICGIKIKPISPFFYHQNSDEVVDILISHYPPLGILDSGIGINELINYVFTLKPKYHVFGHNHSGSGQLKIRNIQFINASMNDELCQKENQLHVII